MRSVIEGPTEKAVHKLVDRLAMPASFGAEVRLDAEAAGNMAKVLEMLAQRVDADDASERNRKLVNKYLFRLAFWAAFCAAVYYFNL